MSGVLPPWLYISCWLATAVLSIFVHGLAGNLVDVLPNISNYAALRLLSSPSAWDMSLLRWFKG